MDRTNADKIVKECESKLAATYKKLDDIALYNTEKVLNAFSSANVTLTCMAGSSGYGYEDTAKPRLCQIYKSIFHTEEAIVAANISCGTHALALPLFGILRPGDIALSITGRPYDTLETIIFGHEGKDIGSLKDLGIRFECLEMKGDKIDVSGAIRLAKKLHPKMIYIQRSRGYSSREALHCNDIKEAIDKLKQSGVNAIFMVDNCYGEFTEKLEPTDVGADIMAGSLMKNIGGGITPTGGYVVGKKELVDLSAGRMTAPELGIEVGSYIASYYPFFEGIFLAPHMVAGALKGSILLGRVLDFTGVDSTPKSGIMPADIVRSIKFGDEKKLVDFCQLVQRLSPIDAGATVMPWEMPGYADKVVSGGGTFIQGSTMELSCDGPVRPPYICYIQGGLTYEHVKLLCIKYLMEN